MAVVAGTFMSLRRMDTDQEYLVYRFTFPTVLAGQTSDQIKLVVPRRGTLYGLDVVCPTSVDFDISLRQKADISTPSQDEVLKVIDTLNGHYKEVKLNIPYANRDTVEADALYLVVINTDAGNATGVITIEPSIIT